MHRLEHELDVSTHLFLSVVQKCGIQTLQPRQPSALTTNLDRRGLSQIELVGLFFLFLFFFFFCGMVSVVLGKICELDHGIIISLFQCITVILRSL
jgi:hypothetical protein